MKTIDEVKDEIAKKYGYGDWQSVIIYCCNNYKFATLNKYENEAMQEYARLCCKHQIILCSNDLLSGNNKYFTDVRAAGIIRTTKLATEL